MLRDTHVRDELIRAPMRNAKPALEREARKRTQEPARQPSINGRLN